MKRYAVFALALLMCCSVLAGCRRGSSNMTPHSPTNEATAEMPTMPTVMPSTRPATEPATMQPAEPETMPATENPTGNTENSTTDATESNRSRTGPNRPAMR